MDPSYCKLMQNPWVVFSSVSTQKIYLAPRDSTSALSDWTLPIPSIPSLNGSTINKRSKAQFSCRSSSGLMPPPIDGCDGCGTWRTPNHLLRFDQFLGGQKPPASCVQWVAVLGRCGQADLTQKAKVILSMVMSYALQDSKNTWLLS